MRPVIRGAAPRAYTHYRQARNDLADRVGFYCSYCEMPVANMIEVEHVVPKSRGGGELDWENFLLSCKYCNTIKLNNNVSREGYVWPDRDNTDLLFDYDIVTIVEAREGPLKAEADATISLMGLNRSSTSQPKATVADLRPFHRLECWLSAQRAYELYVKQPTEEMAELVAIAASGKGFYSIWIKIFANYPEVQQGIRSAFPGTYSTEDNNGIRIVRQGGIA